MKAASFLATYRPHPSLNLPDAEKRFRWTYWKETNGFWMLKDPEGYVRTIEKTWKDSVPKIRTVLNNHAMEAEIS